MRTLTNFKRLNKKMGHFWFAPHTMRICRSKLETPMIAGVYFVTSESDGPKFPRRYTIRRADWVTGLVSTVGTYQEYASLKAARLALSKLITGGK